MIMPFCALELQCNAENRAATDYPSRHQQTGLILFNL